MSLRFLLIIIWVRKLCKALLVQRFANSIFEPVWNRNYVSSVQITVSEDLGVGTRGGYYDKSGALRDMIQNHVMQLLALTAMEPPSSLDLNQYVMRK